MTSNLAPNSTSTYDTYFTHEWLFKRSSSKDLLFANANGVEAQFFEGCRFKVVPNEELFVIISFGN